MPKALRATVCFSPCVVGRRSEIRRASGSIARCKPFRFCRVQSPRPMTQARDRNPPTVMPVHSATSDSARSTWPVSCSRIAVRSACDTFGPDPEIDRAVRTAASQSASRAACDPSDQSSSTAGSGGTSPRLAFGLLACGDHRGALRLALRDPPVGAGVEQLLQRLFVDPLIHRDLDAFGGRRCGGRGRRGRGGGRGFCGRRRFCGRRFRGRRGCGWSGCGRRSRCGTSRQRGSCARRRSDHGRWLRDNRHRLRHVDETARRVATGHDPVRSHGLCLVLVLREPGREPHIQGDEEDQQKQTEPKAEEREPVDPPTVGEGRRDRRHDVALGGCRRPGARHQRHGTSRSGEGSTGRLHRAGFSQAELDGGNRRRPDRIREEPEGGFEPPTYHLRGGCSTPELLRRSGQDTRPKAALVALWNDAPMPLASSRRFDDVRDAAATIIAAAALASFPILIALVRHDGGPIGADTPVYVWWARLVGVAGSSAVAFRPGVPDVTEIVARALGLSETATVAGLGCALLAIVGLAGSAVLRGRAGRRVVPLLGLMLTGLFATYLAAGHLSNAVFAALFVLALAFLIDERRWGSALAAVLLGAAGIAHPEFLWLAVAILAIATAMAGLVRRREAVSTATVGLAGVAITGVGLLTASGGVAFDVPTSLDVFLLQTHQLDRLHGLFLERFAPKVAGYAMWAWLPLAAAALRRLHGRLGRLLLAWSVVTVVGVAAGLVGRWFPPHRIVAFAFCLPLLAAIGLGVVRDRLHRLATPITIVAVSAIAVSAVWLWVRAPRPYADPAASTAPAVAPAIAATPGTVIVDLPADRDATAVAVIRSLNLLRAAVPGDRVRDVVLRYPSSLHGDPDAVTLWRASEDAAVGALASGSATEITAPAAPAAAPLSVAGTFLATVVWLGASGLAGSGWCIAAGHRGVSLVERATGTGVGGLILGVEMADRLGLHLASRPVAIGVVAAVTGAGYFAALASDRARTAARTARSTTTPTTRGGLPSWKAPTLP